MTIDTDQRSGELVPLDQPAAASVTLFGTSDPRLALERMADIATALVDVIDKRHLFVRISGRKHITAEGWTTLGAMLGVVPVVTGTRLNETGDGIVATVEARTLDGRVIGAADGECSRAESKWKNRDPFALRSMAQTRGISRALRGPLGMIVVLAGYEASAAEEMPVTAHPEASAAATSSSGPIPPEDRPTEDQARQIKTLLLRLDQIDPDTDWAAKAREIAGVHYDLLTKTTINRVIEALEATIAHINAA
jgi:hypothetical protein